MGLLNLAGLAAQMARTPIQFTKTVQDGSANPEFRVRPELHVLARIKFFHCIDQADHPGVDQVFQRHLRRQSVMNSPGDVPDLWQMLEQQTLALLRIPYGLGHQCLRAAVIHRTTPRDWTEMPGGISVGERTTTRGRNGSRRRRKWKRAGLLHKRIVEAMAAGSPTNFCKPSSTRRIKGTDGKADRSPATGVSMLRESSSSIPGSKVITFNLRSAPSSGVTSERPSACRTDSTR